jgi:hypothetical protein
MGERIAALLGAAVLLAALVLVGGPAATSLSSASTDNPGGFAAASASGGNAGVASGPTVGPPGTRQAATTTSAAGVGRRPLSGPRQGAVGAAPGPPSVAGPATSPAPGAVEGGAGCVSPPGSTRGISRSQIKIAVMIPNISGAAGNSTFGVPPPEKTKKWYQDVIESINDSGGVACRRLVPTYYNVNPADQSDLQQKCLEVAGEGVFATLDEGGYGPFPQKKCYAQNHIPFFTGYPVPSDEVKQSYPYLFSSATYDTIYKNTVFALRDRGFFSAAKGFGKLGFVYNSCYKYLIADMTNLLHQAGVPDSKIVPYDMGCSSTTMPSPSDVQQAVLAFQRAGVTNVTTAEFVGGFWLFTRVAEQQRFRPKYGIPDENIVAISYGSNAPDANNINGAVAITPFRAGEETTPGYRPSAGTIACNKIHAKYGEPPVYQQQAGVGGMACNELWLFKAAVEHAPALSQESLAAGLQAARQVDLSFPGGPGDMSAQGNTAWMNYWRVDTFLTSCKCWRVTDSAFRPSYT